MLLTLGNKLKGKADIANVVAFTVQGTNTTGSLDLPQPLGQGYLTLGTINMYVATRDITIENIYLVNTAAYAVTGVVIYIGLTPITGEFTIPANSTITYANGVWNFESDANVFIGVGTNQITVSTTPPANPQESDLWVEIP